MTTLSPWSTGMVDTLRSISFSPTLSLMRPSWGSLRSAMFSFAMIFILDTIAACSFFGVDSISCSTPSMRYRHLQFILEGLDMYIACPALHRPRNEKVDEFYDGRLRGEVLEMADVLFLFPDELEAFFADVLNDPVYVLRFLAIELGYVLIR